MKLFNNKKGSTLNNSIYAIGITFAIAIIWYFVIEGAVVGYLIPIFTNQVITSTIDAGTQTTILGGYSNIKLYLRMLPVTVIACVWIWFFITNIRKETENVF